jgi:hypothetical protein
MWILGMAPAMTKARLVMWAFFWVHHRALFIGYRTAISRSIPSAKIKYVELVASIFRIKYEGIKVQ